MNDHNTSRFEFVTKRRAKAASFFARNRTVIGLATSVFVGAAASLSAIATVLSELPR